MKPLLTLYQPHVLFAMKMCLRVVYGITAFTTGKFLLFGKWMDEIVINSRAFKKSILVGAPNSFRKPILADTLWIFKASRHLSKWIRKSLEVIPKYKVFGDGKWKNDIIAKTTRKFSLDPGRTLEAIDVIRKLNDIGSSFIEISNKMRCIRKDLVNVKTKLIQAINLMYHLAVALSHASLSNLLAFKIQITHKSLLLNTFLNVKTIQSFLIHMLVPKVKTLYKIIRILRCICDIWTGGNGFIKNIYDLVVFFIHSSGNKKNINHESVVSSMLYNVILLILNIVRRIAGCFVFAIRMTKSLNEILNEVNSTLSNTKVFLQSVRTHEGKVHEKYS
jgi:hypothetical protein